MSDPAARAGAADRLTFLFGVHNHQPLGNFDHVVGQATAQAYDPFLRVLAEFPGLLLTVHVSGGLLLWLREHARRTYDLLGTLAARGQVELLTGGFYEPILPILPDWDKVGQVRELTAFLGREFGVRPRGMWLAERVWEPHLPRALREAEVEYVLVDDGHFDLAGLDPATLGGYFLTEEQGATLAVFPISQRLRYLTPFAPPEEALAYLAERRGAGSVTLVDDGEKFGVWPGTHRHCYRDGWLRRFFEGLAGADWLRPSTPARYLDAHPPRGRVYLPTAAYREMGEWALPAEAARELDEVKARLREHGERERLAALLRGGFWRNFLVKYPEVGELYWKMLRLSRAIHAALERAPGDPRLLAARDDLWRGQCNDPYWHGVFGGCYLPHLRRAARSALLAAERGLEEATGAAPARATQADLNGDGLAEVAVRTAAWSLLCHPAAGGLLSEIAWLPKAFDLGDVLARRPEAYHARVKAAAAPAAQPPARTIHGALAAKEAGLEAALAYDRFRRASLLDGLFPAGVELDPLSPWDLALLSLADRPLEARLTESAGEVTVLLFDENPEGWPLVLEKSLRVAAQTPELEVRYRLAWRGKDPLVGRWGVQWNLALTGGEGPERYWALPGRPPLRSRGTLGAGSGVELVDRWLGLTAALAWTPAADLAWAPVETVSLSEAGFERIFQGAALFLAWPLRLEEGARWEARITLAARHEGDLP